MPAWLAAAELARDQHGIVAHRQLLALGLARRTIARAIELGRLYPVLRGVYGLGHQPSGRHPELRAATLACGEGSLVSHGTAAALLGFWRNPPPRIDVIAPLEAGRKIAAIRRRHVPFPRSGEAWLYEGVPCTTPARTIVDVAGLGKEALLRRTIEEAAVRRMLSVPQIDAVLDGPSRRGARTLLRLLGPWRRYREGMTIRSRQEAKLLPLLSEHGLPVPQVNEKLMIGPESFEVDFLWRPVRLVVETDSHRFHDNPEAMARDRHRDRVLRGAGFRVWRIRWDDLTQRSESTLAELSRLIRQRDRQPPNGPAVP